jgi:glycosyltransferase involved in cell wall biosynthesis
MAAGKPVLAIKGMAEEEVIGSNDGGFTFNDNELRQMAELVCKLADDPEMCRMIGRKGQERVKRLYALPTHADKIYTLYKDILSRTPA